jgi:hypothetical protein
VKYTGANSLMNDKDNILPEIPECDLPTEEDTATFKDSVADVDANATPDKSVEMLSSSSSSVSTARSNTDSLMTAVATTARSEGEVKGSIDDDDELLDLLVETLDVEFDPDLFP